MRLFFPGKTRVWLVILIVILASAVAEHRMVGEEWAQWRGPFLNGSSSETNLPTQWSKTENVLWKTALPGRSGATPVTSRGVVFVPSTDPDGNLLLFCIDSSTGALRWQKTVGKGDREQGKNNMASCSPVTDGKHVWTMFGTGDLVCFDFDGKEAWRRRLTDDYGTFAVLFLYGASPLLLDGKLYIPILQRNPPTYGHARDDKETRRSVLLCADAATGRTLWEQERKTEAREEAMEAYTTVLPIASQGTSSLILAGADAITAHEPDSGVEQWRYSGINLRKISGGRIVPSPVFAADHVFVCGPKREALLALRCSPSSIPDSERLAWKVATYVPDVCTPLSYQGKLFVLDGDRQMVTSFEPASGKVLWQGRIGIREIFYASPTGADGKIYCLSEEGTVVILSAGDSFEVLAAIPMGEGPCRSSIAPADKKLFIRTAKNIYCISK